MFSWWEWGIRWKKCLYNRPFYSCVLSYLAMYASEARGNFTLMQTSLLFSFNIWKYSGWRERVEREVDKPDSKVRALNSVYRLENGTDLLFIKSPYVLYYVLSLVPVAHAREPPTLFLLGAKSVKTWRTKNVLGLIYIRKGKC